MASGVTNKMRNIHGPLARSFILKMGLKSRIVVLHNEPNREQRRHHGARTATGGNTPYVNLARDNKRGRRLR
jgi:hypothetical protein